MEDTCPKQASRLWVKEIDQTYVSEAHPKNRLIYETTMVPDLKIVITYVVSVLSFVVGMKLKIYN